MLDVVDDCCFFLFIVGVVIFVVVLDDFDGVILFCDGVEAKFYPIKELEGVIGEISTWRMHRDQGIGRECIRLGSHIFAL